MSLSVQPPPGGASGSYADVKTVIASGNLAGRRVCVFAAASGDCKVQPYVRYHLDALKNAGLSVVLILSADRIPNANIRRQAENCDAFMVRKGLATNFESWRDALRLAPSLWLAESVLFVDDSVFGPVHDLKPLLQRAYADTADFIGMTETFEGRRRFPSHFLLLKKRALHNPRLREFWQAGRVASAGLGSRAETEVELLQACLNAGLTCRALFPTGVGSREPIWSWKELIDQGKPYLAVDSESGGASWKQDIASPVLLEAILAERRDEPPPSGPTADDDADAEKSSGPSGEEREGRPRSSSAAYAAIYQAYLNQALGKVRPGEFVPLSEEAVSSDVSDVKLVAYYLPQFHPIPENDEWWGKGFTEWTNVAKTVPSYVGHYQPRFPGEFGYYDLRVTDVMKRQAELARHYGISAFCFYAYWFGGKRLLEMPLLNLLADRNIDIPFCLCWANENWTRVWDGAENLKLLTQSHSAEDDLAFIRYYARYFEDPRYLRVDGKPVLSVYRPNLLPDPAATTDRWREEAVKMGLPGIYLVATNAGGFVGYQRAGFDALSEFPPHGHTGPLVNDNIDFVVANFGGQVIRYEDAVTRATLRSKVPGRFWPGVMPAWDNSARRLSIATIFHGSTPRLYQRWLENAISVARTNPLGERHVMINAWNEWAEGAYLEPDRRFGYAYLAATADALRASGR